MKQEMFLFKARNILRIYFALFSILAFYDILSGKITAIDNIIALLFCGIFLLLSQKYRIRSFVAILVGLVFIPNYLGQIWGYNWAGINYHWDWIVHFCAAFFAAIIIITFLLDNAIYKRFFTAAFIALFVTITFGALVEVTEYWGFIFVGVGDGYLGFGAGDNSQNFGPWENSSIDTTFNFIGSLTAMLLIAVFIRKPIFVKQKTTSCIKYFNKNQ